MDVPREQPHGHFERDSRVYRLTHDGPEKRMGDHFTLREFACNDGTVILLVHPALVHGLNVLRSHFGEPCRITSAYRTHAHNENVGGASNSRHLYGMAADIVVAGVPPSDVAFWAHEREFGGVGWYNDFTHVDVWARNRRWDNRTDASL